MSKKVIYLVLAVFFLSIGIEAKGSVSQAASAQAFYIKVINKYKRQGFKMFVKYDANCTFNGRFPSEEEGHYKKLSARDIRDGKIIYYDLNGDGRKECIMNAGDYFNIFTIQNSKVKYLGGIKQRNGDWISYTRSKKSFVVSSYGGRMTQCYVFKIKNGIMKKICMIGDQVLDSKIDESKLVDEYYYNDKRTSKKKYKKYYNKYLKNSVDVKVI